MEYTMPNYLVTKTKTTIEQVVITDAVSGDAALKEAQADPDTAYEIVTTQESYDINIAADQA
jgi:hypothetical protein